MNFDKMEVSSSNVARFLVEKARTQPDVMAVLAPMGRHEDGAINYRGLSFAELNRMSDRAAHLFRSNGIHRGSRVLLMVKPGLDLIICSFALFKMGAIPVVIDPGMGLKSFLHCVRKTAPTSFVGIPLACWIKRVFVSSFRTIENVYRIDSGFLNKVKALADAYPLATTKSDDLAAILFTSGSTGPAKGVLYEHGQFDGQVDLIRNTFAIEPGEVDLPMLPIFALFNPALGMTTVVPEINPAKPAKVDPKKIIQAIAEQKVTNSFGSPALWAKIVKYALAQDITLPLVRRILMAGAPVTPTLMKSMCRVFPSAKIYSPYGATECLPVSVIEAKLVLEETGKQSEEGRGTCVGKAVSGVSIKIIRITNGVIDRLQDADELGTNEIGEIIVTGPTVTKGYDGLEKETRMSKIQGSQGEVWHRMGDAGYLDSEARLWFCGRVLERVSKGDIYYYTDCIEGIFNAMPGVKRSALIGIGKAGIERPAIVIEPDEWKKRPAEADLLNAVARYGLAREVRTVFYEKEFPVDVRHNAKIHRMELKRKYNR